MKRGKAIGDTNPLTHEDAGELAARIADCEEVPSAQVLLLCHAFTHERDFQKREHMLRAVEGRLSVSLPGFDRMLKGDITAQLATLRARKERNK